MCWTVIRFWGDEIKKNLTGCVDEIKETIYEIENNIYGTKYEYNEPIDLMAAEDEPEYNE
jgi:hypothetical protein